MRTWLSGLVLGAVAAASTGVTAGDKLQAQYKFYWGALLVSEANSSATIDSEAYEFAVDFRIRGMAKLFANGYSNARAEGRMADGAPVPTLYENSGRWDGENYAQTMTFDSTGLMLDQQLDWPEKWLEESKREPVPADMQKGPDPASMVVKLISMPLARATASEPMVVRSFDGDTVFDWDITCLPDPVMLEPSGKSPFSGEAYECSFGGELVAGKRILTEKQQKKAEKRRRKAEKRRAKGKENDEKPPKLWVQVFEDGAYILPVRAEVSTGMGRVKMYLSSLDVTKEPDAMVVSAETQKTPTSTMTADTESFR